MILESMKMAYLILPNPGSHSSKQYSLLVHLLNSASSFPGCTLGILYDPFQVRISKYDAIIQLKKRLKTTMSRSAISQRIYSRHAFKLLLQQETCMHLKFPYI